MLINKWRKIKWKTFELNILRIELINWKNEIKQIQSNLLNKIIVKNTIEPLPMIGLYANYRKGQNNEALQLILKVLKDQFYMEMF